MTTVTITTIITKLYAKFTGLVQTRVSRQIDRLKAKESNFLDNFYIVFDVFVRMSVNASDMNMITMLEWLKANGDFYKTSDLIGKWYMMTMISMLIESVLNQCSRGAETQRGWKRKNDDKHVNFCVSCWIWFCRGTFIWQIAMVFKWDWSPNRKRRRADINGKHDNDIPAENWHNQSGPKTVLCGLYETLYKLKSSYNMSQM